MIVHVYDENPNHSKAIEITNSFSNGRAKALAVINSKMKAVGIQNTNVREIGREGKWKIVIDDRVNKYYVIPGASGRVQETGEGPFNSIAEAHEWASANR